MMLRATLTLCLLAGFGAAAPFSLPNGFPNLDQHALQQVSKVRVAVFNRLTCPDRRRYSAQHASAHVPA